MFPSRYPCATALRLNVQMFSLCKKQSLELSFTTMITFSTWISFPSNKHPLIWFRQSLIIEIPQMSSLSIQSILSILTDHIYYPFHKLSRQNNRDTI